MAGVPGSPGGISSSEAIVQQHGELKRLLSRLQHQLQQLEDGEGEPGLKNEAARNSSRVDAGLVTLASAIDSVEGKQRILWKRRLRALEDENDSARGALEHLFTAGYQATQAARQRQALFSGAVRCLRSALHAG